MLKSIERATEDEDDEDHDMLKENEDPQSLESFNQFLSLRKQLRRSIFKREEVKKKKTNKQKTVLHNIHM